MQDGTDVEKLEPKASNSPKSQRKVILGNFSQIIILSGAALQSSSC